MTLHSQLWITLIGTIIIIWSQLCARNNKKKKKKSAVPKLTRVIPFMLESFNKLLIISGGNKWRDPILSCLFVCVFVCVCEDTFELSLPSVEVFILCRVSLCSGGSLTHSLRFHTYACVVNVMEGAAVGMREPSAPELISSKRVFQTKYEAK